MRPGAGESNAEEGFCTIADCRGGDMGSIQKGKDVRWVWAVKEQGSFSISGVSLGGIGLTESSIMTNNVLSFRQVQLGLGGTLVNIPGCQLDWSHSTNKQKNLNRNSSPLIPNN